jgi:hypothetical protein
LPKEKEPLTKQNVDSLFVEKTKKPDNAIQNLDKLEILKAEKPEKINIIEQSQNIEILAEKQEREPLKRQLVDNIVVEGNDRDNNEIQSANKVEILRSSKPKKQNSIEDNCNLFIPPTEKNL